MPKGAGNKQRLLVLLDILLKDSDEEHPLSLEELRVRLLERGVEAERKTLYDDFDQLSALGYDVQTTRDRTVRYFIGQRDFDLPELRLLVDAVQSSRFLTDKKSRRLTEKLVRLASRHQAGELRRQMVVTGRIKTMNESIYYTVDTLQAALNQNRQVTFKYFDWDINKEKRLRNDGAKYSVSPWALLWDDENYYLIAYTQEGSFRHYRVDRMMSVSVTDDKRLGEAEFRRQDMEQFSRRTFAMYGGATRYVTLYCAEPDWMVNVVLDRFGMDVMLHPDGEGFRVTVPAEISPLFFAWIARFEGKMTVVEPDDVAAEYRAYLKILLRSARG